MGGQAERKKEKKERKKRNLLVNCTIIREPSSVRKEGKKDRCGAQKEAQLQACEKI